MLPTIVRWHADDPGSWVMLRRVFRDATIYGLGAVVSGVLAILTLPIYARVLSVAEFGVLEIMVVGLALAKISIALEIGQGFARFYGDASSESDRTQLISTAWWFSLTAYLLFVVVAAACAGWVAPRLLGPGVATHLWIAGVGSMAAGGLFSFGTLLLRWQLLPRHHLAAHVAQVLSAHGIGLYLAGVHQQGALGVLAGQIAGSLIGAAMALWWSRRRCRLTFNRDRLWEMLAYSLPLVPSSLGLFLTRFVDRIAINRLMTLADLGLYSVGFKLVSTMGLVMIGLRSAWMPLVFARYREPGTPAQMARVFRYVLFVALLMILGLALFAPELLALLATEDYASAARVVPLLALSTVLGGMYIFAPGLVIAKRTRTIAGINLVAAAINATLNFVLIPIIGLYGAAGSTLLATAVSFMLYMRFSQKLYPVPHDWGRLATAAAITAASAAAGLLVNGSTLPYGMDVLVRMLIFVASVLLLLLQMIGWSELAAACRRVINAPKAPTGGD